MRCAYLLWIAASSEMSDVAKEQAPTAESVANLEQQLQEVKTVAAKLETEGRIEGKQELVEDAKILREASTEAEPVEEVEEVAENAASEKEEVEKKEEELSTSAGAATGVVKADPAPIDASELPVTETSGTTHHWFFPLMLMAFVVCALFVVQKKRRDAEYAEKNALGQDLSIYYSDGYQVLL